MKTSPKLPSWPSSFVLDLIPLGRMLQIRESGMLERKRHHLFHICLVDSFLHFIHWLSHLYTSSIFLWIWIQDILNPGSQSKNHSQHTELKSIRVVWWNDVVLKGGLSIIFWMICMVIHLCSCSLIFRKSSVDAWALYFFYDRYFIPVSKDVTTATLVNESNKISNPNTWV